MPHEPPLTRPIAPLTAAALTAAMYGLRAGSPGAVALAVALSLLVGLAVLWARLGARRLCAAREVARRASEDERIEVRFRVANEGPLPLFGLEIEDLFPADREPRKAAVIYPSLGAFTSRPARYRAECDARRGIYAVGPVSIVARDPLGIARAVREIGAVDQITVYPRVSALGAFVDLGGGNRFDAGREEAGRAGAGLEFLGTREYRPGDALRLVHWPSTARAGRLIVKEMEDLAADDVAIYIDLERRALRGIGRVSTVEYAIRIAASVATHVTRGANRVRLYARGARPYDVPPGAGDLHLARIFEALAVARGDGETPIADVLRETAPDLARGATAVAVLTSLDLDLRDYAEVLTLFQARGVRFVAVLIDARTFLKVFDEQSAVERAAPERREVVQALLGLGATVYEVARGDDIGARFLEPLVGPGSLFRGAAGVRGEGALP